MKRAIALTLEEWETLLDRHEQIIFRHIDGSKYTIIKRKDIPEYTNSRYVFIREYHTGGRMENICPTLLSLFLSMIFVYDETVDFVIDADAEHIAMLPEGAGD